jgi:FMN phosphatase YigB (HAD superfamily)
MHKRFLNLKAIIFDWGRTLHDPETDRLFDGVPDVVQSLAQRHAVVIVSLATSEPPEQRKRKIRESSIAPFIKTILVSAGDKEDLYEAALADLKAEPWSVAIVDDQIKRGVRWGRKHGTLTIWFRNGKFANDLPLSDNETPDFTVTEFRELSALFEQKREKGQNRGK